MHIKIYMSFIHVQGSTLKNSTQFYTIVHVRICMCDYTGREIIDMHIKNLYQYVLQIV